MYLVEVEDEVQLANVLEASIERLYEDLVSVKTIQLSCLFM
jgi:hypothetical protein